MRFQRRGAVSGSWRRTAARSLAAGNRSGTARSSRRSRERGGGRGWASTPRWPAGRSKRLAKSQQRPNESVFLTNSLICAPASDSGKIRLNGKVDFIILPARPYAGREKTRSLLQRSGAHGERLRPETVYLRAGDTVEPYTLQVKDYDRVVPSFKGPDHAQERTPPHRLTPDAHQPRPCS
jgi:hypothetical protein